VRGGDTPCACSFMYSVQFGHGGRRCTVDATQGHPRQMSAETAPRLTPDHGRAGQPTRRPEAAGRARV